MAEVLINPQSAYALLLPKLNAELRAAAKPILDKALLDIERELQIKLGSLVISMLDSDFSVTSLREELRITVRRQDG